MILLMTLMILNSFPWAHMRDKLPKDRCLLGKNLELRHGGLQQSGLVILCHLPAVFRSSSACLRYGSSFVTLTQVTQTL